MSRRDLWLPIRWSLVLVLFILVGCGSGTGAVKGRVTFRGKPVVSGSVVLMGAGNKLVSSPLNAEGRYAMNGVPLGTVQVAIVSPNPDPPPLPDSLIQLEIKRLEKMNVKAPPTSAAPKTNCGKWFPLPKQYALADTSGITTTIHTGDNTFDIELK